MLFLYESQMKVSISNHIVAYRMSYLNPIEYPKSNNVDHIEDVTTPGLAFLNECIILFSS